MASLYSRVSEKRRTLVVWGSVFAVVILVSLGIFASNGWLPRTDPFSGKRYGWFGNEVAKNAPSSWNPIAAPPPEPTPQLSKEYVYAGSRLLAVEDKNATAAPPADLAVWRPSSGIWYVYNPATGSSWVTQGWGQSGDTPIPGDFDGDGTTDFSIFRPGTPNATWYIIHSSTGATVNFPYALSSDLPAQADYDGDGKTDPAVYRPPTGGATNGVWYIQGTSAGYYTQTWGEAGDIPASADHDGDGRADIAVFRPDTRTFYSIHSSNNTIVNHASSIPAGTYEAVSSDYDGDGRADYAVYDKLTANWYIRPSTGGSGGLGGTPNGSGFVTLQWGNPADLPVQNDYDADARTDLATWRPTNGTWYIRQSANANALRQVAWGQSGDIPVPAFYRR